MGVGSGIESRIHIEVAPKGRDDRERQLLRELLTSRPRRIPSRYFYDAHGSELFEQITELPEYYLTRTETAILERNAADIVERTGATELVELGSGSSTKTRILLDAMADAGCLHRYVPFDVSEPAVRAAAATLAELFPEVEIHGVIGEFDRDLGRIPSGERRLVLLIGSTIGNFAPAEAATLLARIAEPMAPGDWFLLGADLVKDPRILEAAYNDSRGVTARFNLNALRVLNRIFDGDIRPDLFEHKAIYDREHERIEMRLVAREDQSVHLDALDLDLEIEAGEEILTEISCKYRREVVERLLTDGGFEVADWLTDPDELFALALARRTG